MLDGAPPPRRSLRRNLLLFAAVLAYIVPLFWLQGKAHYPDSFGLHLLAHGRGRLIEEYYDSYVLIERRHLWDVVLFLYMWAPAVAGLAWIGASLLPGRGADRTGERRP